MLLPRAAHLALLALAAQDPSAPAADAGLSLPDGRAAKVLAGIAADTQPAALPEDAAQRLAPDAWEDPRTWQRWADAVAAESRAARPDGARRALLCLLARSHGRTRDAWEHFGALGDAPEHAAAVGAFLIPGVPPGTPIEAGGRPAPLPSGAVLSPFLPPRSPDARPGAIEWRSATYGGLRIGDATVDLSLSVESTGVQLDLTLATGDEASIAAVLPAPDGFSIRVEYLDWSRQPTVGAPLRVVLRAGDEEPHSLYGRVLEDRVSLPAARAGHVPRQLSEGGLRLELPRGDPQLALLKGAAPALAALLGAAVVVVEESGAPSGGFSGTTMRLPAGPQRAARLRYLVGSLEAHALAR
jgi:hypothetical protein